MLLYNGRYAKSEKVGWWWWWVSSRSGWLLELLTELKTPCTNKNTVSSWILPSWTLYYKACSGSQELWLLKMVVTATPWQLEGQNEFRVPSKLGPMHFFPHIVPWQVGPRQIGSRNFLLRQSGPRKLFWWQIGPQYCFGGILGLGKLGPKKFGGKLGFVSRRKF